LRENGSEVDTPFKELIKFHNPCETVEKPNFYDFSDCNTLILLHAKWLKSAISDFFDRLCINPKYREIQ